MFFAFTESASVLPKVGYIMSGAASIPLSKTSITLLKFSAIPSLVTASVVYVCVTSDAFLKPARHCVFKEV